MVVHTNNLITALDSAIRAERENERKRGFQTDSALVAGWQDLQNHLQSLKVRKVEIKECQS